MAKSLYSKLKKKYKKMIKSTAKDPEDWFSQLYYDENKEVKINKLKQELLELNTKAKSKKDFIPNSAWCLVYLHTVSQMKKDKKLRKIYMKVKRRAQKLMVTTP